MIQNGSKKMPRQAFLQVFGGDVNLIHIVCSGQIKLVMVLILQSGWYYFRKEMYCIGLEKWGSKEGTKGEKKVYRAHPTGLFLLFWERKRWVSGVRAPDLVGRKARGAYFGKRDATTKHEGWVSSLSWDTPHFERLRYSQQDLATPRRHVLSQAQ